MKVILFILYYNDRQLYMTMHLVKLHLKSAEVSTHPCPVYNLFEYAVGCNGTTIVTSDCTFV